jgi:hypothetical protein
MNQVKELRWTWLESRHTCGSQLALKGESLYKISKLMGKLARDLPSALRGVDSRREGRLG